MRRSSSREETPRSEIESLGVIAEMERAILPSTDGRGAMMDSEETPWSFLKLLPSYRPKPTLRVVLSLANGMPRCRETLGVELSREKTLEMFVTSMPVRNAEE